MYFVVAHFNDARGEYEASYYFSGCRILKAVLSEACVRFGRFLVPIFIIVISLIVTTAKLDANSEFLY